MGEQALDSIVRSCLEAARSASLPWQELQAMASEVVYGSRLSSAREAAQLDTLVQHLLHEGLASAGRTPLVQGLPEYFVPPEKTLAGLKVSWHFG